MPIFNADLDDHTDATISSRLAPIKFIKQDNYPSQEELTETKIAIKCLTLLTKNLNNKEACITLQEKATTLSETKTHRELIFILQGLCNKVPELATDATNLQHITKAFIVCSMALDIMGVPPIFRYHTTPKKLICEQLMLLSDYLWLQTIYNAGKLRPTNKALPRLFGKASSGSTRILLALNELLHRTANPYKERARWAFIRPSVATFKFAAERQLACVAQGYGLNMFEWFLKTTTKVSELVEIKPQFKKFAIATYNQTLVWQCAAVSYGRISDAARLYSIMAGCQVSRQAMAKQILRLERDLPEHLHYWRPNSKHKH